MMHKVLKLERWHKPCTSRKEGGRELATIEDCVNAAIQELGDYIKKSKERLLTAANCSYRNISTDRKAIVQAAKIDQADKWYMHKPESVFKK